MFNRTDWVRQYRTLKKAEVSASCAYEDVDPCDTAHYEDARKEYCAAIAALQDFLRSSLTVDGVDQDIQEACQFAVNSFESGGPQPCETQEEIDATLASWCESTKNALAHSAKIQEIIATTSRERLDEFRHLKLGWLQSPDQGQPCSLAGLDWVTDWLEGEEVKGLPQPYSFPTESGGVQLSWDLGEDDMADLEIDLDTKIGKWYVTMDDLNAEPPTFDLSTSEGTAAWRALISPLWLIGRRRK